jgi:TonB family protein
MRWLGRVVLVAMAAAAMLRALPVHAQAAQAVPKTIEPDAPPTPVAPPKIEPPRLVTDAGAEYPERALTEKFFQTVTVSVILEIDPAGAVKKAVVDVPQGHGFDEAAVDAAAKLTFAPATKDGVAVAARVKWKFVFAPPAPRLKGRVAHRASDAPIAGARVTVRASDGVTHEVTTGADGRWAVDALAPGPVHVEIASGDLAPDVTDETLSPGEETNLVVRLAPRAPAAAGAADAGAEEEVTVRGERPPREVTKRTLTREEIGHIPGTNGDALRSLQNLPGVARPPPFRGLLVVRGSAPEDTNIYVDGTNIPIVYHFGGLSSVVPTEVLDKIDFYPGNYSAQYGRGMGGIVDVGIRDPNKDGRFHGMAQADLIDTRLVAEGPIGDTGWKFLAAGRRSWFDVWLAPILSRQGDTSVVPRYYDYQVELQKDLNKHSSFRLLFFGSDDELRIVQPASATGSPILAAGISDSTRFWRLQARYINKIDAKTELRVTAAVGEDVSEIGFGTNLIHVSTIPTSLRAEVSNKLTPGVVVNSGLDVIETPYNILLHLPPRRRPGVPPNGPGQGAELESSQSGSLLLPGAYSEWELTPWRGTRLVPGLRADYDSATKGWDVAPRFNGRQDLTRGFPRTTLKGGVGVYYQPPQPRETDPVFGQTGLSSNRSVAYDVGFEQEFTRQIDLSMDVFYKALDRLVTQGAGNSGDGFAEGAEWLVKYKPDERFFGWLAYTLSRSERRQLPGEELRLFQYDQTHILTVIGSYKLDRGWQLGARFRLVSGNLYTPSSYGAFDATAGTALAVSGTPLYSARLPLFEQLDVRVDKTWTFAAWKLTTYLDVQNVYNRANAEGVTTNYNSTKSSNVTGIPLLPSLGVRAEF